MNLTNEEVLDLAEKYLEYSDFGNWHGNNDAVTEFAYALIRLEKERMIANVLAA
jgi:hypothetical protein